MWFRIVVIQCSRILCLGAWPNCTSTPNFAIDVRWNWKYAAPQIRLHQNKCIINHFCAVDHLTRTTFIDTILFSHSSVFIFRDIDKIRRRKLHETWRLARVYHALECILTSQKIIIIFAIVKATTKANRWATQRCYVHFVQWMRSIIMAMKMTHMNSIVIRLHTGFNHIGSNVPFNNGQDQPCHIKYYYRANNWCIIRNSSIKCFYKCFACFEQLGIFVRFLFLYCGQLGLQTDDCAQWCQQFNIFIFRFAASEQRA